MNRKSWMALLLLVAGLLTAPDARAGAAFGPQIGLSAGPTQFLAGLHLIVPAGRRLDFAPSVDVGLGNPRTTISLNADLHVNVAPENSLRPYLGIGVTGWAIPNDPGDSGGLSFSSGPTLLGGIWVNRDRSSSFYVEAKVGLSGVPDFKALIGLNL